ncbi:tripartite tricarboxylate transporter substrate binding protein [Siccirubricoccus sp. KC 17139]|uniref:Tripartite tricarboxylate transporter substrate binding protein n=1 Tax=Siccirubricoccus soli TaxID=2899147 RepID=A0ABT1D771_9PROT|nr:tripartite tricarboxylate transporter substrate binding protein [Siccirubricoccus soli]MCO6417772.1 tripartite tricarboxylate transporter substrate binding protein [Siccirubricoccus soli]MCP2683907.1 tripartite tricarboxylate transporter substrate binding protein [Siccirubricoccus soli]
MIRRRLLLGAALAVPALAAARAQGPSHGEYPDRPIRYLCPYPPGATNDNVSRTMSRALSPRLGVPVVVENKAGAGGTVGSRLVAEAKPDGYTLLNASAGNLTIAPHLSRVGYDPLRDLVPVALAGEAYSLVAVNPKLGVSTLAELIALARRRPGFLNYASSGIGSAGHLRGALLMEAAGVEAVHVPFPGSAAAATSVITGDCHLIIDPIAAPHAAEGRLQPLATVGAERWEDFAGVPTLIEQGFGRDWPVSGWFGLFAPRGTPEPVIARLNREFNESLAQPEVNAALRRFGLKPEPISPEELARRTAADHAAIGATLRRLDIA